MGSWRGYPGTSATRWSAWCSAAACPQRHGGCPGRILQCALSNVSSTIDWRIADGVAEIPIEARSEEEVTAIQGRILHGKSAGEIVRVQLTPDGCAGFNPAFDVTPARLVTALITDCGVTMASEVGLKDLYKRG